MPDRLCLALLLVSFATGCAVETDSNDPSGHRSKRILLLGLEDRRDADLSLIRPLLHDEDPDIRARAALSLGRIASPQNPRPELRLALEDRLLDDSEGLVRSIAAFALGESEDPQAQAALVQALGDSSGGVRADAAEALVKCGVQSTQVLRRHFENESDPKVQERILLTSWRVGDAESPAWAVDVLDSQSDHLRWAAAYHLVRFPETEGVDWPSVLSASAWRRLAGDDDPEVRKTAARLMALGRTADPDTASLAKLLTDPDRSVRIQTLRAAVGQGLPVSAERFREALSGDDQLALEAVRLAGESGLKELIPTLRTIISKGAEALAAEAFGSLARLAPGSTSPDLKEALGHSSHLMRAAAVRVAGPGNEGAAMLDRALEDSAGAVRLAAVTAWAARPKDESDARLVDVLAHRDIVTAAAAAQALQGRRHPRLAVALDAAYRRSMDETNFEAKSALLQAAAQRLPAAPFAAILRSALRDPDRKARLLAALALKLPEEELRRAIEGPSPPTRKTERDYAQLVDLLERYEGARIATTRGDIVLRFAPKDAPMTVANFVRLAQDDFYDGIVIHRVVPDFVVQAGCPRADGWGEPGYDIRCEINPRHYRRGSVGMALAGKDTGGSQWFIALAPQPHLDGGYTIFAEVATGWDAIDRILPGDRISDVVLLEELVSARVAASAVGPDR